MDQILLKFGLIFDQVSAEDPFAARSPSPQSSHHPRRTVSMPKAYATREPRSECFSMKSHLDNMEDIHRMAKSQKQKFMVPLCDGLFQNRTSISRTGVTGSQFLLPSHQTLIHLSKPLDVFEKLVLRVDAASQTTGGHSFMFGLASNGNVMCETEVSQYATADSTVTFELATGRKLVVITIQGKNMLKVVNTYMYLAKEAPAKSLFPVIQLSGNAETLSIVDNGHKEKVQDPIRKRPNGSSVDAVTVKASAAQPANSSQQQQYHTPSAVPLPAAVVANVTKDKPHVSKTEKTSGLTELIRKQKAITAAVSVLSEDMKDVTVSADGANKKKKKEKQDTSERIWYSNQFVMFKDSLVTKKWSLNIKNYIFGSEIRVDQSFVVKIIDIEGDGDESAVVHVGFTKQPLLLIDMTALPENPVNLCNSEDWFLTGNLFTMIGAFDGLKFTRSGKCITLSIESGEKMAVVSNLDPTSRVFPFIFLSGCVKSLEVSLQ